MRLRSQLEEAFKLGTERVEKKIATEQLRSWAEIVAQADIDRGLDDELRAELGLPLRELATGGYVSEADESFDEAEYEDGAIRQEDRDLQQEDLYAMGQSVHGSQAAEEATRAVATLTGIPQSAHKSQPPPTAIEETSPHPPDDRRQAAPSKDAIFELDLPGAMVPERYFILTRVALRYHRHKHYRVADHYSGHAHGLDYRRSESMTSIHMHATSASLLTVYL